MTDVNVTQQDSNQAGQQQVPEGMVEDMKEPQGGGVTATPGDPDQQGNILSSVITVISDTSLFPAGI